MTVRPALELMSLPPLEPLKRRREPSVASTSVVLSDPHWSTWRVPKRPSETRPPCSMTPRTSSTEPYAVAPFHILGSAIPTADSVGTGSKTPISSSNRAAGAHVRCEGKGRKERCVPLTKATVADLKSWLCERHGQPDEPLFPTRVGRRLSSDAVERRVAIHAAAAARRVPSLANKHLTPHVLRHTTAMQLLQAGVDTSVIALWLGHADTRSTQAYLHADMSLKEKALARTTPPSVRPGRYRPPDALLAFLESL